MAYIHINRSMCLCSFFFVSVFFFLTLRYHNVYSIKQMNDLLVPFIAQPFDEKLPNAIHSIETTQKNGAVRNVFDVQLNEQYTRRNIFYV